MAPVKRELFDQGLDSLGGRIVAFLDAHRDNAYSAVEIAQEVRPTAIIMTPEERQKFLNLLLNLAAEGHIEAKKLSQGFTYFASVMR